MTQETRLGSFMAGRIHGVAAARAYLAAKREARVTRALNREAMTRLVITSGLVLLAGYIAG